MTFEILNFRINPEPGTLKATADVCFESKVTVCGARLVQNKKTGCLFLSLPTRKVGTPTSHRCLSSTSACTTPWKSK